MTNWDKIVEGKELKRVKSLRSKRYIVRKERRSALLELQEEGWEHFRDRKDEKWIDVRKEKSYDEIFEDKVWVLLAEMGFTHMNSDRNFRMQYDYQNPNITQQIDVFAADDETVLIVECKAANEIKNGMFKKPIEAFYAQMKGLTNQTHSKFPGRKVKFIWATSNYNMNNADMEKLKEWNITYFNDSTINYYTELVKHLGTSAKYQLLGNLFANQDIKNMDNKVPAIQGKMGKHTYYLFSIEPEKLLKIGYVLHRSEANKDMMPTYQRFIKKTRLEKVQEFIKNGGYFPNSIIINIETNGRKMQFDEVSKDFKMKDSIPKLGILHLPKKYKSAYIIDGQHRLYGYSGTDFASKNTIPVVAFEELDREEQVQLFMDINENQKAVPKNSRNILNINLLWNVDDKSKQRIALRSKIAQMLGEEETSPLLGRVMVGDDEKSDILRCITINAIQDALKVFFDVYDKSNKIIKKGIFDFGDNQKNCDTLFPVLKDSIAYIRENCLDEWNLGKDGLLTINRGMQAVIKIIGDIIELLATREPEIINWDSNEIVEEIKFYLDPLCVFLNDVPKEVRDELRSFVGAGANKKYWRTFQKAIADSRNDFAPEGLEEYYRDEAKLFNHESQELLQSTYLVVKQIIATELENKYGRDWFAKGLPIAIYKKAKNEADEKNYALINSETESNYTNHSPWEFVDLTACSEIVTTGSHWTEIFEEIFVRPEESTMTGGKKAKTEWMRKLDSINKNLLRPTYSVPKVDYEFIKTISDWINSLNV